MRHKSLNIILFFSLITPVILSFGGLYLQKLKAREEIRERILAGMDRKDLVLLSFPEGPQSEIHWKHQKEFEYHGEYYDVVKRETRNGRVHYWCWPDNKETEINKRLNSLLADALGNGPFNPEHQARLIRFIKSLYLSGGNPSQALASKNNKPLSHRGFLYATVFLSPATPPPKSVFASAIAV